MKEISYVMVKPGFANYQAIIDEVRQRIFEAGLEITDESFVQYTKEDVKKHYAEHLKRSDYPELEKFIVSDKVYGMKVEGESAILIVRSIMGEAKNPAPGTIRHDIPEALGIVLPPTKNVTHASDSVKSAERELEIFYDIKSRSLKTKEEDFNYRNFMENERVKTLTDKIINWAKENGKNYQQEIDFGRVYKDDGDYDFVYRYPDEMGKFINKMGNEIADLENGDLRKLEDALVHIPDERAFIQSQVTALNLIRRIVFLEIDKRRNKPPIEPGE